jgi:hypothetical protein
LIDWTSRRAREARLEASRSRFPHRKYWQYYSTRFVLAFSFLLVSCPFLFRERGGQGGRAPEFGAGGPRIESPPGQTDRCVVVAVVAVAVVAVAVVAVAVVAVAVVALVVTIEAVQVVV